MFFDISDNLSKVSPQDIDNFYNKGDVDNYANTNAGYKINPLRLWIRRKG